MTELPIILFADRLEPQIGGMEIHAKYFIEYFSKHPIFKLIAIITKSPNGSDYLISENYSGDIDISTINIMPGPGIVFFNSGRWIEELSHIRKFFSQAKFIYRTGGNEIVKAPLINNIIHDHPERQKIWVSQLNNTIDLIVTNSSYTENRLLDLGITCPFFRSVGGVNIDVIRKCPTQKASSRIRMICAARFVPYKGHSMLIEVFNKLIKRGHNIELYLAGDGPLYDEIKKKTEELNLNNFVTFLGVLDNPSVCQHIAMSDVYIQLSSNYLTTVPGGTYIHSEGMGRSILEAISAGTYVIAGDSGALSEVIHKKNGTLLSLDTINSTTNQIEYILKNLPQRPEVCEKYSWNSIFKSYEVFMRKFQNVKNITHHREI